MELLFKVNYHNVYFITDAKKLDHIAYSKFCRRIFYYGKKFDHFKTKETEIVNGLNKISNPKYNESELGNITGKQQ